MCPWSAWRCLHSAGLPPPSSAMRCLLPTSRASSARSWPPPTVSGVDRRVLVEKRNLRDRLPRRERCGIAASLKNVSLSRERSQVDEHEGERSSIPCAQHGRTGGRLRRRGRHILGDGQPNRPSSLPVAGFTTAVSSRRITANVH